MTNEEVLVRANETKNILKMIWHRKHRRPGQILRHDNLLHDIIKGKMIDSATRGRKRMDLLHNIMKEIDYGELKDIISDRSRWRQDSK